MSKPTCIRLSSDLSASIEQFAAEAGVSVSEWIRDILYRVVYNEPPGIDQGYMAGRQLGFRMMQIAFKDAWDQIPTTVEEAIQRIQNHPPYPPNGD